MKEKKCCEYGTRLVTLIAMNLVTTKAVAKHEHLVDKPGWVRIFSRVWPFYEWAESELDLSRGCIFSWVGPFYEQAVSDLDP
jgi:hypothetical protein